MERNLNKKTTLHHIWERMKSMNFGLKHFLPLGREEKGEGCCMWSSSRYNLLLGATERPGYERRSKRNNDFHSPQKHYIIFSFFLSLRKIIEFRVHLFVSAGALLMCDCPRWMFHKILPFLPFNHTTSLAVVLLLNDGLGRGKLYICGISFQLHNRVNVARGNILERLMRWDFDVHAFAKDS